MQEILILFLSSFTPFQRLLFLHVGPVFYLISYFFSLNKSLLNFLWCRPAGHVLFFNIYFCLFVLFWLCCVLVAARELPSCGTGPQQLWCMGLTAPQQVGSQFPNQGSNPAMEGGFLTTGSPEKVLSFVFCLFFQKFFASLLF